MIKLRIGFLLSFLALSIPFGILLSRSYRNLDEESFFFYRRTAESAEAAVSRRLEELLRGEQQRSYTEYRYLHVPERSLPSQEGLNLSPLSNFPVQSEIPGTLGYFQIDPDGSFSTPLLPPPGQEGELNVPQFEERRALEKQLRAILEKSGLPSLALNDADAGSYDAEEGFKPATEGEARLLSNLASNADLSLQQKYAKEESSLPGASEPAGSAVKSKEALQQRRVEPTSQRQALVFDDQLQESYRQPADPSGAAGPAPAPGETRLGTVRDNTRLGSLDQQGGAVPVGAEVDPFQSHLVDNRWVLLERKVWWNDRRYVQGLVVALQDLGAQVIDPLLQSSALPEGSGFLLFHDGELVLGSPAYPGQDKPLLLENSPLPSPFSSFHLALTVRELPPGPGRDLLHLMAAIAAVLIPGGVLIAYRLSATQWRLSRKQSDFVAAISHELKSPLTSIRMYGEMLMEGWVDGEEKKQSYYRHIHDESERLSRLIQNVLRLAQLERGQWDVRLSEENPAELLSELLRQFRKSLERASFSVRFEVEGQPRMIRVDRDALTQILINLFDNAVKFAANADPREILVRLVEVPGASQIRVRDFGPGIPRGERKRIFQQFYRIGSEMTRTTRGTGIGLALVKMLMQAMGGSVEVANCQPGAEFRLSFPTT